MKRYVHSCPTQFSEYMTLINQLKNDGITELPRRDVEAIFGNATQQLADELEYLGCEVTKVADLFNVVLPSTKFTREEIKKQKELERIYNF